MKHQYLLSLGVLAMLIATLAHSLNRSRLIWFLFGMITGPFALFCLMLVGKVEEQSEKETKDDGKYH